MPGSRIQGVANAAGTSATVVATGAAVKPGNGVLVAVSWDISGGTAFVSLSDDKSNAYTLATSTTDVTDNEIVSLYYALGIVNAPSALTLTLSNALAFNLVLLWEEFAGLLNTAVDQKTSQLQNPAGTGTDGISSGNITPTWDGALLWGYSQDVTLGTRMPATGTGFTTGTQISSGPLAVAGASEYRNQSTKAAIAATFTNAVAGGNITGVMSFPTVPLIAPPSPGASDLASYRRVIHNTYQM
jgi:hypothetical protein